MSESESNGLGIAGFILSILGLVSCGLLAPFGLILSLFGLRKQPKGLAIAGTVIGAVAVCGWSIPIAIFGTAFFGVLITAIGLSTPEFETRFELGYLDTQVQAEHQRTGAYPTTLTALNPPSSSWTIDGWGNAYVYTPAADGSGYDLFSMGPDGLPNTADDLSP